MINILDSNALQLLQKRGKSVHAENRCMVSEVIQEEFLAEDGNRTWFTAQEFEDTGIDFGDYLTEYAKLLNEYNDVSFYNLKGFGDVAILAVLSLILAEQETTEAATLSKDLFPSEEVVLVSNDEKLRNFAGSKFGERVTMQTPEDFEASL